MLHFLDSFLILLTNLLIYTESKVSKWGNKDLFESEPLTLFIKNHITESIILVTASSFCINLLLKYLKRKQHNIRAINKILEDSHLDIFGVKPSSDGNSRITYYKSRFIPGARIVFFKKLCFLKIQFGWADYLVIASRTGCFQESITKFKIHENIDVKGNGVAGKAWYSRNSIIREEKLPSPTGAKSSEYARRGNINEKHLKRYNVKASSLLGLAIQNVDGERIGVIVIDTKHKQFPENVDESVYKITEKLMYVV